MKLMKPTKLKKGLERKVRQREPNHLRRRPQRTNSQTQRPMNETKPGEHGERLRTSSEPGPT